MAATKKSQLLRQRVAAAACTLLGLPAFAEAAANKPAPASGDASAGPATPTDRWSLDLSYLRYSEADRVKVNEPQVGVRRDFSENRSLSILLTVDSITGATPIGTLPATQNTAPATITSASGRNANPIIGKIPLANFRDTRYALDTIWRQPIGTDYTGEFGLITAVETDFIALGASTKVSRDFNQKNTSVFLGLAPEYDFITPNGGLPVPFATQDAPGAIDGTRDTRWLLSGLAGLTQVINRRTVMQFNYGLTFENGNLNDPYKLLSLVNAQGDPLSAIYEKRPTDRLEHSFYWLTKYNIWAKDVFSLGLRYYSDDWGIHSGTLDFAFRRQSTDRFYWEPHVRYYSQSGADFFHSGLRSGNPLPDYATADLRLADIHAVTIGLRTGYTFKDGSQVVVRAEYYSQTGESKPNDAVGDQQSFDLFPTLYASILQLEYHFEPSRFFKGKK